MSKWNVGSITALVAFVSVALAPWVYLVRGPEDGFVDLLVVGVIWLMIGTFAAANGAEWRKRDGRRE